MARVGRLTKLKSAIKKLPSFTKLSRTTSSTSVNAVAAAAAANYSAANNQVSNDLHAVYVGKRRRRYLVNSDVIVHPLFQELVDKSGDSEDGVVVSCEVVLFEHLLWMLENAEAQMGSMDELVEFYTC